MVFGRKKKKKEEEEEVELISDEDYDAEAELQKQLEKEKEYEAKLAEKEEAKAAKGEEAVTVESLMLKTEKLDGKIAALDEAKARVDDRMMRMSEQIGELRTMLLDRERKFGVLEADFEMIKDVFEDVKPAEISKQLNEKDKMIAENTAKIEKLESMNFSMSKEVSEFRATMNKIKSFENLVDIATQINEKLAMIDESKKYSDRVAAKIETIFSDLNEKLREFTKTQATIQRLDEITKDLMISLDQAMVKIGNLAEKDEIKKIREEIVGTDLKNLEDSLKDRIEGITLPQDLEEKVTELVDFVGTLERKVTLLEMESNTQMMGSKMRELGPELEEVREIERLNKEKKELLDMLTSLGEDYREGMISKESYDEMMGQNRERLEEIEVSLKENLISLEIALKSGIEEARKGLIEAEAIAPLPEKEGEGPSPLIKGMRKTRKLTSQRKKILDDMKRIEKDYREGTLSKESYEEAQADNRQRLSEVALKISEQMKELEKYQKGKEKEVAEAAAPEAEAVPEPAPEAPVEAPEPTTEQPEELSAEAAEPAATSTEAVATEPEPTPEQPEAPAEEVQETPAEPGPEVEKEGKGEAKPEEIPEVKETPTEAEVPAEPEPAEQPEAEPTETPTEPEEAPVEAEPAAPPEETKPEPASSPTDDLSAFFDSQVKKAKEKKRGG